jgi:hypothetical protein
MPVREAELKICMELDRLRREHDLTDVEMLRAVLSYLSEQSRYMLRVERHPDDPERKADEE